MPASTVGSRLNPALEELSSHLPYNLGQGWPIGPLSHVCAHMCVPVLHSRRRLPWRPLLKGTWDSYLRSGPRPSLSAGDTCHGCSTGERHHPTLREAGGRGCRHPLAHPLCVTHERKEPMGQLSQHSPAMLRDRPVQAPAHGELSFSKSP